MPPFNRRKPQFFITDPLIGMVLWRRMQLIFIKNYNFSSNLKIFNFRLRISICLKMSFVGLKNFLQVPSLRNFSLVLFKIIQTFIQNCIWLYKYGDMIDSIFLPMAIKVKNGPNRT